MIKKCISVTSHALDSPFPCHKLSHLLGPPPSRALRTLWTAPYTILHRSSFGHLGNFLSLAISDRSKRIYLSLALNFFVVDCFRILECHLYSACLYYL